jgi:putative redox protein
LADGTLVRVAEQYRASLDVVADGRRRRVADPMQTLLRAFAGCDGTTVLGVLRKMRQDVTDYRVELTAERADEPPRAFTAIHVEHVVTGRSLDPAKVERAIELAGRHCSVGATIRFGTKVTESYRIVPAD